ncbi:MAG: protein CpxP [Algoriphagus sp.]|jgi:protein CpxP
MKKWILASGLVVMISLSSIAQQRGGERLTFEQRAARMTEKMAEELSLTADQKNQILSINLEHAKKRNQDRVEQQKESEARKAEMDEQRAEMRKQDELIKAILTDEQRTKWEEIKLSQKDRGRRPGSQIEDRVQFRKRPSGGN